MADGGDNVGPHGPFLMTEGEWAGWRHWVGGDPYEDLAGPYYFRADDDGAVRCAFRAEAKHMNGGGFMHGGCMLTFADYALFVIGREALKDTNAVTVSLNGEFVGPAHVGDLVEATGEVVRAGGSLVFLRGTISTGGSPMMTFSGGGQEGQEAVTAESALRDKLRKIEALFAGAATAGEKAAAGAAADRIRARLRKDAGAEKAVEVRFSIDDIWSRQLFMALCRRYGIAPFRYRRMHKQTVIVKAPRSFIDQVLWPEFQQLSGALIAYLSEITETVIREEVHGETADAEERDEPKQLGR